MRCNKCGSDAVFFQAYSGRHLCSRHLALDIEARAKRSIRSHRWMTPGDTLGAVIYGDRKSAALLYFLKNLTADRRDIRLCALPDGGTATRTEGRSAAMEIAESLGIPVRNMPPGGTPAIAGTETVTRIALAISLDDIAVRVLAQFLFGDAERLIHPLQHCRGPVPVICPFITIPSDELEMYAETGMPGTGLPERFPDRDASLQEIKTFLDDYSRRHPATKYALLHIAEQLSGDNAALTAFPDTADSGSKDETLSQRERPNS